jgi:hypothetical protein
MIAAVTVAEVLRHPAQPRFVQDAGSDGGRLH